MNASNASSTARCPASVKRPEYNHISRCAPQVRQALADERQQRVTHGALPGLCKVQPVLEQRLPARLALQRRPQVQHRRTQRLAYLLYLWARDEMSHSRCLSGALQGWHVDISQAA